VVADWGLEVLELDRVELLADVDHTASRRAAEKAGFTWEGTARRSHDLALFSRVLGDGPVPSPT
jgi:RimJ/RimL family protein N-acetyltransferase